MWSSDDIDLEVMGTTTTSLWGLFALLFEFFCRIFIDKWIFIGIEQSVEVPSDFCLYTKIKVRTALRRE
jgi:hypothetical protein